MEELIKETVTNAVWRKIMLDSRTLARLEPAYNKVFRMIKRADEKGTLQPPRKWIFRALNCFPPQKCAVVICGQDPYPNKGQPNGFAFATGDGSTPASLLNIYKEIRCEYGTDYQPNIGRWPRQGVLLLNAILSNEIGKKKGHHCPEWNQITDFIIRIVDRLSPGCVFMLWGNEAQEKETIINVDKHLILAVSHPSPLSFKKTDSPFLGSGIFQKCNEFLGTSRAINW